MKRGDIFTKTKQNSQKGYQNGKWSQAGKNWFGWQGEGKKETQEEAKEIELTHCASNALHVMALRTNRLVLTGGHTREVTVRIKAKQAKLLSNKYRTMLTFLNFWMRPAACETLVPNQGLHTCPYWMAKLPYFNQAGGGLTAGYLDDPVGSLPPSRSSCTTMAESGFLKL